ncbi:MAG: hypothetical protein MK098_01655 [Marinovum sp.]|nr:hypothetical protein [Marinovum sp.]
MIPAAGQGMLQLALMGVIFAAAGFLSTLDFARVAGGLGNILGTNAGVIRWQGGVVGSIYIGLGVRFALHLRQ